MTLIQIVSRRYAAFRTYTSYKFILSKLYSWLCRFTEICFLGIFIKILLFRLYFQSLEARAHDQILHRSYATPEAYDAMRPHKRPDKGQLESIASRLDPLNGTDEPVVECKIPKASTRGHGSVLEFGIENRALQYLARDALNAVVDLHPNQFATRGGNHAAIRQVEKALCEDYVCAVELDITSCYESFEGEQLFGILPLPKGMIDNVIISKGLCILDKDIKPAVGPRTFPRSPDRAFRKGLPHLQLSQRH